MASSSASSETDGSVSPSSSAGDLLMRNAVRGVSDAPVADGQLGRQVLRVGGTAAVAEQQNLAAALDRFDCVLDQGPQI